MDDEIIAMYCVCDDMLKGQGHCEDLQRQMSDAEVLTTALVAARFFGGNLERARALLAGPQYMPGMVSKSRLNRRLHALASQVQLIFQRLGERFTHRHGPGLYLLDSFPLAVCDNIRIPRAKLYQAKAFRGYIASKRRYFYGLRLYLLTTAQGEPVEAFLAPGATADVTALPRFAFDLPPGSTIYGDSAFTWYVWEDVLQEASDVHLQPVRKKNSRRPVSLARAYLQSHGRKWIETAGSLLTGLFPKSIHAVTASGFELKIMLFLLAYSFSRIS